MLRILHPWYLLLLPAIPVAWRMARRVRVLGRGRKTLALILRSLVLTLFILALSEVEWVHHGESLTVFFVIDRSSSIPAREQQFSLAYVQERLADIPRNDRAGILFFGKEAAIQENPGERVQLSEYQTIVNPEGTDIEAAIGLAMAAFPEGTQKRIILITDGNQTQGNAEAAAQRAKANRVDLRILPLEYAYTQEALMEEVVLPPFIREKEPFTVKALVRAQEDGPAKLRLSENGKVVAEQDVQLKRGKNAFTLQRTVDTGGFYSFEAGIEAANDTKPSNNRAQNFAIVKGTPRILLLEGEPQEGQFLAAALLAEGIQTEMLAPEQLPDTMQALQMYDSIILSNVPASDLSKSQQRMLDLAVRDLGIGLVMIGGPKSFGAGGYLGSPVEAALPVSMDVKQRRVIPSGALALIVHSCEIPQGNYWSKEISLAALEVLSQNDYFGFLRYSSVAQESWLLPLEKVGLKIKQRQTIQNLEFLGIGDMPDFGTTLEMAYSALVDVRTNLKHIVILSDGDPQRPTDEQIRKIREAQITLSTVCIAPHNQTGVEMMQSLAQQGGGNFYYVQDNRTLPKIFTKEAATIRRTMILEEPFTPTVTHFSEILRGFNRGFPNLDGYVITTPKPEAETVLVTHKGDPLLAHWRYGLGKAAAFTSDAKRRWASQWLGWERYGPFWAQVVRWTLRSGQEENFQVQASTDGNQVKVVVDALTKDGDFINQLKFRATAIDPTAQSRAFEIRQTQPGRYEGSFTAPEPGNYLLSLTYQGPNQEEKQVTTGVSVPFSPEHYFTRQNDLLLKRLAEITGKPVLTAQDHIFQHDLYSAGEAKALWPLCLGLAIALFFLDIAARRVFFELPQIERFFSRLWDWVWAPFRRRPQPVGPATEEIGKLMEAKTRAFEAIPGQAEAKELLLKKLEQAQAEEIVAERGKEKPAWRELRKDEEPQPFVEEEKDEYTSALFRAKQRAEERLKDKK